MGAAQPIAALFLPERNGSKIGMLCQWGDGVRRCARFGGLGEDSDDDDVNEVEMLLEAVFIQVDNTHNKLQTLHEYIDDTEVGCCDCRPPPSPVASLSPRAPGVRLVLPRGGCHYKE